MQKTNIMEDVAELGCLLEAARQPRPYTTIGRSAEEWAEIKADREFHLRKGE